MDMTNIVSGLCLNNNTAKSVRYKIYKQFLGKSYLCDFSLFVTKT